MTTKFTPGPWTQGKTIPGITCVWLNGATEPLNEMGDRNSWIDCNTEANARLIAAAPELLEALIGAANYIDRLGGNSKSHRIAIAKATGEQQ